jgi:hypothetical protein
MDTTAIEGWVESLSRMAGADPGLKQTLQLFFMGDPVADKLRVAAEIIPVPFHLEDDDDDGGG